MTVNEILINAALLGVGLDNPSPNDLDIFLRYLNLAHWELIRKTAPFNPRVVVLNEEQPCIEGVVNPLNNTPFAFKKVYESTLNRSLEPTSIDEIQKSDPGLIKTATYPSSWYYFNNTLNVYPIFSGTIGVWYIPQPTPLDFNTLEQNIPYPIPYHPILIDGTCYYLFQGEGAFKDGVKMQTALARWEKGKTELMSYLISLSGQTYYSTFSQV